MLLSKAASAAAVSAISEWLTYRLLVMDEDGGRLQCSWTRVEP